MNQLHKHLFSRFLQKNMQRTKERLKIQVKSRG